MNCVGCWRSRLPCSWVRGLCRVDRNIFLEQVQLQGCIVILGYKYCSLVLIFHSVGVTRNVLWTKLHDATGTCVINVKKFSHVSHFTLINSRIFGCQIGCLLRGGCVQRDVFIYYRPYMCVSLAQYCAISCIYTQIYSCFPVCPIW